MCKDNKKETFEIPDLGDLNFLTFPLHGSMN